MPLFPPIIPGTLPPVTEWGGSDSTKQDDYKLTIPYEISRGVNPSLISGYKVIIKGIPSNQVYYQDILYDTQIIDNQIIGRVPHSASMSVGSYYKLQMAFTQNNNAETGYYSTVGTFKFIACPTVELSWSNNTLIAKYTPSSSDLNEKLYTTKFFLYNQYTEKLIEQSEEIVYNYNNQSENNEIIQSYRFNSTLKLGEIYKCVCEYTTSSGYIQQKTLEDIATTEVYPSPNRLFPAITLDYTNGLINICVKKRQSDGNIITNNYINTPKPLGNYILSRSSDKSNYENWENIKSFSLNAIQLSNNNIERILFKDLNVEHGVTYQYAIQQYNSHNLYSSKNYSNFIKVDYEDMYLTDGIKQLRIAYNPKISNFKDTVLENKQDTIGSQYPFFFRNNEIAYKEFSLSGLLSYLSDPDNLFNLEYSTDINTTNLTGDNIAKEKQYKLEVLNWLNNGENKLLKTATEGTYYVRLMNISLSPNETLGRMLHTFQATAYEVENANRPLIIDKTTEYVPEGLGIISLPDTDSSGTAYWSTGIDSSTGKNRTYWQFDNYSSEKNTYCVSNITSMQFLGIEQVISNEVVSPRVIKITYKGQNDNLIHTYRATEVGLHILHNKDVPIVSIKIYQNTKPLIICTYELQDQEETDTSFSSQHLLRTDPRPTSSNPDINILHCSTYNPKENGYFGAISYCCSLTVIDESDNLNEEKTFSYLDQAYELHEYKVNKQLTLSNILVTGLGQVDKGLTINTCRIKYIWGE